MRVDLTIVALFDAEHEVDAAALQDLILYAEVPGSGLETVQDVRWDLIFGHSWVHDLRQLFHGKFLVLVDVHEAFLEQNLFIEEPFLSGHLLEACGYFLVTINHQDYQEIIFCEVRIGVSFERVIIMEAAAECMT